MGYWTGYSGDPESALIWSGLTHIIHWNAVLQNSRGSLSFLCAGGAYCTQSQFVTYAQSIVSLAHANNVKVMLGVSDAFSDPMGPALTNNFNGYLSNIMSVVNAVGYDGIDVDWDASINFTQYASFLSALRSALGTRILTGTTSSDNSSGAFSFWATQTKNGNADRVNFMTYDMQGGGAPHSWFNSALYSDSCNCVLSWDLDRSRIIEAGVPAAKLNMGIPFYGYLETGVNGPRQHGQTGASQVNYKAAVSTYNLSTPQYDGTAHEPWIQVSTSSWLGFENRQSLIDKVNYVKRHSLGGWIIFNLSADYLPSQNPKHPLLAVIASAMQSTSPPNPTAIIFTKAATAACTRHSLTAGRGS
jgi:chitinase